MTDKPKKTATTPEANPFDPSLFRAQNTLPGSNDGFTKVLTQIPVGKPKKSAFFRAHPSNDYRLPVDILEDDSGDSKDAYLVIPGVAQALNNEVKPKLLVLVVDKMGNPRLWPAPRVIEDGGYRQNSWNTSALTALDQSTEKWTRMSANISAGSYEVYTSESTDEPQWPAESMGKLMELGFGEKHVIRDIDHPVIRRLLGRD